MVKFHILSMTLMNSNNRVNHRRTKATAAIPMAGAIVTAALLLSGLSLITSYQPVMAQQNMTGGVEGGGATTSTIDNATSTMGGAAQGGNATTTTTGGGANQSTSDVRMNIEQARMALQNNDTQGAMMYLDMALSALGGGGAGTQDNMTGNMTSTSTSSSGTTNATSSGSTMGATTEGGAATSGSGGTTAGGPTAGQGEGSGGGAAGSGGTTAGQ
jgi:hypothetical protein